MFSHAISPFFTVKGRNNDDLPVVLGVVVSTNGGDSGLEIRERDDSSYSEDPPRNNTHDGGNLAGLYFSFSGNAELEFSI